MASGRMLKQTIATDKRLNGLSIEAEYLYLKCIPHLDRDGLIHGDAPVLWGTVCPRRTELLPRIAALVSEWVSAELVIQYSTEEGDVLFFLGFAKNQTIRYDREGASRFAPPPGYVRTGAGLEPEPEKPASEQLRINSGLTPELIQTTPAQSKLNLNQSKASVPDDSDSHSDRDGKYLLELLRFAGLLVMDSQARKIAMQLESDHTDAQLRIALDKTVEAHQKQIKLGKRGITAPLAYMSQVLAGMNTDEAIAADNNVVKAIAFSEEKPW